MVTAMRNSTPHAGFTLVELMITIAVAGILLTVAIPSFQGYIANQRVKTDANALLMSLLHARSEAVKRNEAVSVVPSDSGWAGGWSVVLDSDASTLRSDSALSGVTVNDGGAGTVTFARNGRLATASPTFELCDTNNLATKRRLTIGLTGSPIITLDGGCTP